MKRYCLTFMFAFIVLFIGQAQCAQDDNSAAIKKLIKDSDQAYAEGMKEKDMKKLFKAWRLVDEALTLSEKNVTNAIAKSDQDSKSDPLNINLYHINQEGIQIERRLHYLKELSACNRLYDIAQGCESLGDKNQAKIIYSLIVIKFEKDRFQECATQAEFALEDLEDLEDGR